MTEIQNTKHTYKIIYASVIIALVGVGFGFWFSYEGEKVGDAVLTEETIEEIRNNLSNKNFVENKRSIDSVETKGILTKTYNVERKEVEIKDDKNATLIKARLLTHYNQMVGEGENVKVAEIQLIDWTGDDLFDSLYFFDKKEQYQNVNRNFVLKYADKTKTEEITAEIPTEDGELVEVVVNTIEVPDWDSAVAFTKLSELPRKDIPIGIYTNTTLNESVEWLPLFNGIEIYEWAAYDVTELNTLEHDIVYGGYNSLVMIDATHFILAYTGEGYDGYISTFSIDGSYAITELNTLEHDTVQGIDNSLVMIDATHFILAYAGSGSDGYISTFSIDGSYAITELNTLEHDIVNGTWNSLVMIDATHFILAYTGEGYDGYISTFSIDGSYAITELNTLEHDIVLGADNSLVMIDATHFILAYVGELNGGYITTFSIDGSYAITELNTLEHDIVLGQFNSLVMIDATHFILAYTGTDSDGYISTFSIDGSYAITELNTLEHDIVFGWYNSLVMIDATHFILAYTGELNGGYISTFSIDGSYAITELNTLEHDIVFGQFNSLVMIDATHFILAYAGTDDDGYISTFFVEGEAAEEPSERSTQINSPQTNLLNDDSLVGYWSFNGPDMDWASTTAEARDLSGNANHGDVINGAKPAAGKAGQGLSFDGVDDYVKLGGNDTFKSLTEGTVAGFIKVDDLSAIRAFFAVGPAAATSVGLFYIFYVTTDGRATIHIRRSDSTNNDLLATSAINSIYTGIWYHLAWTVNSGGNALYVNGIKKSLTYTNGSSSTNYFFDDINTTQNYWLGARKYSGALGLWHDGLIDEVRVYNRALSEDEIGQLYRSGARTMKIDPTKGYKTIIGN